MTRYPNGSTPQWTAEEIDSRLGISTAIYQKVQLGARQIAEIRQAGIERIEVLLKPGHFHCDNRAQVVEVLKECKEQRVRVVAVHGRIKLPYRSEDEEERKLVLRESISAIRFAEEAGASIFVAHFGCNEHSEKVVMELLDRTDGCRIKLTTENMGALPGYVNFAGDIGSDRFGVTVDIGHPRDSDGVNPFVKEDGARQTLAQCGNRVFHLHLHETFDLEEKRDHRPPLHEDGIIEWGEVFAALRDIEYGGELLFEDGRGENPEEWIQMTAAFPLSFVQRYGS